MLYSFFLDILLHFIKNAFIGCTGNFSASFPGAYVRGLAVVSGMAFFAAIHRAFNQF